LPQLQATLTPVDFEVPTTAEVDTSPTTDAAAYAYTNTDSNTDASVATDANSAPPGAVTTPAPAAAPELQQWSVDDVSLDQLLETGRHHAGVATSPGR